MFFIKLQKDIYSREVRKVLIRKISRNIDVSML